MITGIAHVCFTVSDLDASIDFYSRLGFTEAFDFINDQGERFGIYLHVGGRNFIELFRGELSQPAEGQSYRHVCLEVDNLKSTMEQLADKGVEVTGYKMGSDNSYQAWITDPDGNRVELHEYTAQSKQTPWLK